MAPGLCSQAREQAGAPGQLTRDPDMVFPECCDPDDGTVGVGGDVFSGDSR